MKKGTKYTVYASVSAALYVVLTFFANMFGLASMPIQVRFSEALTILPLFTPAAVPGLFIGCVISNVLCGSALLDTLFGSIATLLGALGTYYAGKYIKSEAPAKWLGILSPVFFNTLIVPFVLSYVYEFEGSLGFFFLTVGIGEVLSAGVLGLLLYNVLKRNRKVLFK